MGLFQSEKYFIDIKSDLINEIYPPYPKKNFFLKESMLLNKDSVAICSRSA